MGSSLLQGFLDAIIPRNDQDRSTYQVNKLIACTNSKDSASALEVGLARYGTHVSVRYQQNIETIAEADVIVLGFKPSMAKEILEDPEVRRSVSGKLVISLLAGQSVQDIRDFISKSDISSELPEFWVAKAIPNLAARHGQSMTILEQPSRLFPSSHLNFLQWMFGLVGRVKVLDDSMVDVGSVLVTTCLASLTVPIDGILDGSVMEGFKRQDALDLVTQSVLGLGALLFHGNHPAPLRERISSPKGCTIQSLVAVERGGARVAFTDAILQGTQHLKRTQKEH